MPTLLLTLRGAQQSWGSRSRFSRRNTEHVPTRSGVIGLLAAALGLARTEPLDRFDDLEFGVRVDQPGTVERDFQTAVTESGVSMPLSHRFYLADATFVAGFGSDDIEQLRDLERAVRHPVFPLYLGRRAFPPSGPIRVEVVEASLRDALRDAAWQAPAWYQKRHPSGRPRLELFVDAHANEPEDVVLDDIPRSFDPRRRRYDARAVRILELAAEPSGAGTAPAPDSPASKADRFGPMTLVAPEEV